MQKAWAFSLLLLLICATARADGVPSVTQGTSKAFLDIVTASGALRRVRVSRDAFVAAGAKPRKIELVAERANGTLIVIDTFASRPGAMSLCQAGTERSLRILVPTKAGAAARLVERDHLKLESCHGNIELADGGVEWREADSTLRIRWLQGPTKKGELEERVLHIE